MPAKTRIQRVRRARRLRAEKKGLKVDPRIKRKTDKLLKQFT